MIRQMKYTSSVIGLNFIVLFGAMLALNCLPFENSFIYFMPPLSIMLFDFVQGLRFYHKGEIQKARIFILAAIIILTIGFSSCVTIRFKQKRSSKTEYQNRR